MWSLEFSTFFLAVFSSRNPRSLLLTYCLLIGRGDKEYYTVPYYYYCHISEFKLVIVFMESKNLCPSYKNFLSEITCCFLATLRCCRLKCQMALSFKSCNFPVIMLHCNLRFVSLIDLATAVSVQMCIELFIASVPSWRTNATCPRSSFPFCPCLTHSCNALTTHVIET